MPKSNAVAAKRKTAKKLPRAAPKRGVMLLVGTRKGAWILKSDAARRTWKIDGPHYLGHVVQHLVLDPRDRKTMLMATKTGHLGPTVFRSTDRGRTWKEAAKPPAFAKAPEGKTGRAVDHVFWLTPGHVSQPGVWYAGTSPQGLFRSEDGGVSWAPFSYINDDPQYLEWMGTVQDGTPDGPKMHSIIVDPRDANHLYFAMSSGGVHESTDGGKTFKLIIGGMEVVQGFGFKVEEATYHDPHNVVMSPSNPDRLWQQNHCGIYRLDRPSETWVRVGVNMPKKVGDIGFPIAVHPRDADTAWVFPMDGTSVWPRVSPDGKPAVYRTKNAGKTWQRLATGLPPSQSWMTVLRQSMAVDSCESVGVYFGTSSGELWASRDEGAKWQCIARNLPEIYSVEAVEIG